jgi:SprT protein
MARTSPRSGIDAAEDNAAADAPAGSLARAVRLTLRLTAVGAGIIGRPAPAPRVLFDLRGQAAGQFRVCAAGEPTIRYNRQLLARHEAEFLAQTVPHEVAHYLAYLRFGRGIRPHGREWQQIMQGLGADPRRCHDFDVTDLAARRVRRHLYHCRCGEHALTSIRHHRIQRGASYVCRGCGQALQPGGRSGDGAES